MDLQIIDGADTGAILQLFPLEDLAVENDQADPSGYPCCSCGFWTVYAKDAKATSVSDIDA